MLAQLGHPERYLPPVLHIAGTNGKGSTCAFMRAIGEAAGWRVHVTTSPHLLRINERFRLAGDLVSDAQLSATLSEIERINAGAPITVFEVLAAAAMLLFARTPADLAVIEVGLGGRFDATNVVRPAAAAIATISFDHQEFLGDTLAKIAGEKAGIIKPGLPVATVRQPAEAAAVIRAEAAAAGAPLLQQGRDWHIFRDGAGLRYQDAQGDLALPLPSLAGAHQIDNAGLAIAAMRAAGLPLPAAVFAGIAHAEWPARLQRLTGTLALRLPPGFALWLDGAHNEGGALALAATLAEWHDRPLYLVIGMKQKKDPASFLAHLLPHATAAWAVVEPGQHMAMPVADIQAAATGIASGPDVRGALARIGARAPGRVLICGSLYLAGEVLRADGS